jgi:filamentous hemagglutinin family protein
MRGPAISRLKPSRRMAMLCTSLVRMTGPWLIMACPDMVLAQAVLPQGGSVVSGQARIGAPSGNGLTIVQNSSRAIIDWNSFSVGQNGSVNFIQPNASSAILNRVTGSTPSTIAGQVTGNGQLFLVNPNGIAITSSGSVQVGGGFIGSTLDIGNADFNAGHLNFAGKGASAGVSNAGVISSAPGGFVGLIGGSVSNAGTIHVPLGKVGLGSGEQATFNPTGDGFLQVAVPTGAVAADGRALIDVAGRIRASGGTVEIKAATAQQAVRDAVNISGSLSARSVSGRSGNIMLDGGAGGNVAVSGRLSATGGGRHAGGTIVVTGRNVRLTSSARLNASGTSGGNILVGGDLRGGLDLSVKLVSGTVANARTTVVDQGAVIDANGSTGAGGHAVIWSDIATDFRGTIIATGAGTGTGGAVEVSSHGVLGYNGLVDVRSASGKTGTLLLDPFDVTISSGADSNMSGSGSPFSPTGNSSVLSVTTLQNALASANVTVNTGGGGAQNGDITVANAVTWASGNALTLSSARDINVNANITSNGGGLTLTAGRGMNVTSATIDTAGGNLAATASTSDGTSGITLNDATISVGSGAGTLTATTSGVGVGVSFSGSSSLTAGGGGTLAINGTSSGNNGLNFDPSASLSTQGNVTLSGTSNTAVGAYFLGPNSVSNTAGNLTINGTSTSNPGVWFNAGAIALSNSGAGTFAVNGTSSSSSFWGVGLNTSVGLTSSGNLTLSGTSGGGSGILLIGANSVTDSAGNLTLTGTSTSNTGFVFQAGANTLTNSGAGTFSISGGSGSGTGLLLNTTAGLTTSGTMTLSGTSTSSSGVNFVGSNTLTASSGNLTLTGTSTSGSGTLFSGSNSVTNAGAGTLTVNATSSAGSVNAALMFASGSDLTTSGSVTLSGNNTSSYIGLYFQGSNSLVNAGGDLTLIGMSASDAGIQWRGSQTITNSGSGTLSYNGTGSTYRGLDFFSNASFTFSGNAALTGTSDSGSGVQFGINTINVTSGNVTIDGTSTSGAGALLAGANSFAHSGAGSLTLSGTGNSNDGIQFIGNTALTTSGSTTLSGTSSSANGLCFFGGNNTITDSAGNLVLAGNSISGAAIGFAGANTVTNSGAGTLSMTGIGNSGSGFQVDSSGTLATSGTMTLSGTSTSGFGFYLVGSNTLTASSGNLTLAGSSALTWGMELAGASSITNSGAGTLALNTIGGIDLNASITSTSGGPLVLSGSGSIIQSAGTISATDLLLSGASGSFSLNASGNQIGTLAANAMAVAVNDNSALTVGTVLGTSGVTTSGSVTLTTAGDLTIASGAPVSGASPVLAATGAFINSHGSSAVTATSGRWLIYSSAPGSDTFGALDSANTATWNATFASLPPGSVTVAGNRYLFANQPTLTVTSTSATKTYGTDVSASIASNYTVSGYQGGAANAYLADSSATAYGGAPSITSTGAGATATVAGSPYTISAALGSLASTAGYAFSFQSNGALTVNQKALTVTATDASKAYGSTLTFAGTEFSTGGLVNGDSVTSASLASTGAAATAGVAGSPYAITASGASGSGLANYAISYVSGALIVNPASITVTALGGSSTYGSSPSNPGLSATGLQNGQGVGVLTGLSNSFGINSTTNAGGTTLNVAGVLSNANYTVTGTNTGSWTVNPKALTVTANNASKTYGTTLTFAGIEFSAGGLVNGDSVTSASLASAGAAATAGVAGSPYAITVSGAGGSGLSNYTISYVAGALTVNPKALSVTVNDASKTYGSTLAFAGTEFATSGLVNGDSVTSASLASTGAAATAGVAGSPYAITATGAGGSGLANYAISYVTGALTVNPALVNVTALGGASTYGSSPANPGLSATGLQNGQAVGVLTGLSNSFGIANTSNAGSYTLSVAGSLTNANYTLASTSSGSWTVNPASVSVTALGGSSTAGASPANPGLSATGLQNGENASVLTGLRNSFGVTSASRTGSYTLSVAGSLTNANYVVTATGNGTWTVTPLQAAPPGSPSPPMPDLSSKRPQNENSLDVLNGLRNASDAVKTSAIASSPSPWSRPVGPAPIVSSPVSVPVAKPGLVPNVVPAPDGADVPATAPRVDAPSNAPTISPPVSSAVAGSACAGDDAAGGDHSSPGQSFGQSQGCGEQASKNSAGLIDFALKNLNRNALFGALDRELSDLRNAANAKSAMLIKAVAVTSVVLTVGFIGWLLRSGALLTALLSTLPLWQEFDPLILVRRPKRRDDKQPPPTKVDLMFDDVRGLDYRRGRDS